MLALGTAQFGNAYGISNTTGLVTSNTAQEIISLAASTGITVIDTAYGYGPSEALLGSMDISAFNVVTKVPAIPHGIHNVYEHINEHLNVSLARLNRTSVYGVLLHSIDGLTPSNATEVFTALSSLKDKGIASKIGVSIYDPQSLSHLVDFLPSIDIVQSSFNVVDRRLHLSGWLDKLFELDVEVHARSAYLQGLLLLPTEKLPPYFEPWKHVLEAWHTFCSSQQIAPAHACLLFLSSYPQLSQVVVGVQDPSQLMHLTEYSRYAMPAFPSWLNVEDLALINPTNWPA